MGDDGAAGKAISVVLVSCRQSRGFILCADFVLVFQEAIRGGKARYVRVCSPAALPDCAYNRRVPL